MIDTNDYVNHVHRYMNPNDIHYAGVLATMVTTRNQEGRPVIITGCWRYCQEKVQPSPERHYGELSFIEFWIPDPDVFLFLDNFNKGRLSAGAYIYDSSLDSFSVGRSPSTRYFQKKRSYSPISISGWSEVVGTFILNHNSYQIPFGPHIKMGLPPVLNAYEAIADWVWKGSDPKQGKGIEFKDRVQHVWPDYRARIKKAAWVGNLIRIKLDINSDPAHFEIQTIVTRTDANETLPGKTPVTQDMEVEIKPDAQEVDLLLVDNNGNCLSNLTLWNDGDIYDVDALVLSSHRRAEIDLLSGEGKGIEFKEYFTTGDPKIANRFIHAVVAFANQRYGRIYLGVDNEGSPVGEHGLNAVTGTSDRNANINAVKQWVENQIIEKVKPTPRFHIEAVEVRSNPIVVVEILPGEYPRYSTNKNIIYVRRGSTCHVGDPYSELVALFNDNPSTLGS